MTKLVMPPERKFGWELKPTSTTHFHIHKYENGQFSVVLNHSLVRGCTSEMIYWWFLNFPNLRVKLIDVEGYENQVVPAYQLWHPSDHLEARLIGKLGPNGTSRAGAKIWIREAMQYLTYGWKYPVDDQLKIFYVAPGGWAMGKTLPLFGPVMCLRIHYKDARDGDTIIGVHYHYEIVIGLSGTHPVARQVNKKISKKFSPEFFEAWQLHNSIEVGTWENFLPGLFTQREDLSALQYSKAMNPVNESPTRQKGFDRELFESRVAGYEKARNPYDYQARNEPSFL